MPASPNPATVRVNIVVEHDYRTISSAEITYGTALNVPARIDIERAAQAAVRYLFDNCPGQVVHVASSTGSEGEGDDDL